MVVFQLYPALYGLRVEHNTLLQFGASSSPLQMPSQGKNHLLREASLISARSQVKPYYHLRYSAPSWWPCSLLG